MEMTKIRLCAIQKMINILKKRPRIVLVLPAVKVAIENQLIADTSNCLHSILFFIARQLSPKSADVQVEAAIEWIEFPTKNRLR